MNATVCETGDIVTILDEGKIEPLKTSEGKVKDVLNIGVECNSKQYTYTPAKKSLEAMQEIFKSTDSSTWLGKKFSVLIKDMEVRGRDLKVIRPQAA